MLVSVVPKLGELILLVLTTNAVIERSRSMFCRVKTYLQLSMTRERLSSSLIVTTNKKQVDKAKLVEAASFVSKMNIAFLFKNRYLPKSY